MGGLEGFTELFHEVSGSTYREAAIFLQDLGEITAFDESHGNELYAAIIAEVVNAQYVWVGNLASEQEFLFEALERLWILDEVRTQNLESYGAVQLSVMGPIDFAHPTGAEKREDVVTGTKIGTYGER